jgi:hypothetical protein
MSLSTGRLLPRNGDEFMVRMDIKARMDINNVHSERMSGFPKQLRMSGEQLRMSAMRTFRENNQMNETLIRN